MEGVKLQRGGPDGEAGWRGAQKKDVGTPR